MTLYQYCSLTTSSVWPHSGNRTPALGMIKLIVAVRTQLLIITVHSLTAICGSPKLQKNTLSPYDQTLEQSIVLFYCSKCYRNNNFRSVMLIRHQYYTVYMLFVATRNISENNAPLLNDQHGRALPNKKYYSKLQLTIVYCSTIVFSIVPQFFPQLIKVPQFSLQYHSFFHSTIVFSIVPQFFPQYHSFS